MAADGAATPAKGAAGRSKKRRVFFALWPDNVVARQLHAIAQAHAAPEARVTRVDTVHLTLAFVGDINAEHLPAIEAVGDAVRWPRFTMTLDEIGLWRHNHILWVAPRKTPQPLAELVGALAEGLRDIGVALQARAWSPHVTLVRRCTQSLPTDAIGPIQWRVGEGVLVQSQRDAQGAHYQVRRRWPAHEALR